MPNTAYELKFWSYDSNPGSKDHSQAYAGLEGTTGSAGPIIYPASSDLDDIDSFSAQGTFTSDELGVLTIALTDTITAGNVEQPEPRLNGFQISLDGSPTSPSSLALNITPDPSDPSSYQFEWNSQTGKIYDLVTSADLTTSPDSWPVWDGNAGILASGNGINTLSAITSEDLKRFFAIVERDPPAADE